MNTSSRNEEGSMKEIAKNSIANCAILILTGLVLFGCTSTKKSRKKTILSVSEQNTEKVQSDRGKTASAFYNYGFDNHEFISLEPEQITPVLPNANDALAQTVTGKGVYEVASGVGSDIKSPVADKIVENYLNSENKEPKGHCLSVSKVRLEQAYKEVYGHSLYQDLPDSMATKSFTPKQVFNLLYASASETHQGWRSLPEKYRGKGNAGAIVYAGMGILVDTSGIWNGQLRPGALMQVWRYKEDYEQVVQGTDVKKLDPYGHSFIFISYVRDEKNTIIGLKIADQGFQSYRPLIPRDYEVWWGVNLSI